MDYILHLAILSVIYAILAVSLDLLVGHGGLLSMAHAGLFGVGAYTSALLSTRWGLGFEISLASAIAAAVVASYVVSLPSLRLHDDYFVIATLGLQSICFSVFNNWSDVTRGPLGITGIPAPSVLGFQIHNRLQFFGATLLIGALVLFLLRRLVAAPFGRILHAVREDEVFGQSLGKDTVSVKVTSFAFSAACAGAAGALYAHYVAYIDPTSFTVSDSIFLMAMVILGGAGSLWGPVIGAAALTLLPEMLRFLGLPTAVASNLRQILYGGTLVGLMMFRPRGLAGKYEFD